MATLCPPRRCEVVGIYTAGCSCNTLGAFAAGMGNDCLAHMLDSCFPPGSFGTCHIMLCIGSFTLMSGKLCRLRGWAVAGMSIDYVKCLDLIPQAVVLALALELGMDPGTCNALGAMYKELHWAFKVAAALGRLWQDTNGIL